MPFCRNCGKQYNEGAKFCGNCGSNLTSTSTLAMTHTLAPRKDPSGAALLAAFIGIFLLGIGHLYVGRIGRGIILLFLGIIVKVALVLFMILGMFAVMFGNIELLFLAMVIGLVNIGLWVWQIFDAYKLARKYNEIAERTGKPPW